MTLPQTLKGRLTVPPNGSLLDLQTAHITPDLYAAIRAHTEETHEEFATRLHYDAKKSSAYEQAGIDAPDVCAAFRMHFLEGIEFPATVFGVSPAGVRNLIDIAGDAYTLAAEFGVRRSVVYNWCQSGVPSVRSRWSHVLRAIFDDGFWRKV